MCTAPVALAASRSATDVQLSPSGTSGGAELVVSFDKVPAYSARLAKGGKRLIIDVPDSDIEGAPPAIVDGVGIVGGVLTQAFQSGKSQVTRVLVTLKEEAKYSVRVQGKTLVIRFEPGKAGVVDSVNKPGKARPAAGATGVTDVRFRHDPRVDRVLIELSSGTEYRLLRERAGRSRLRIETAALPESLERTLDVSAFGGSVRGVSSYRTRIRGKSVTMIEVDREEGLRSALEKTGSTLAWSFYRPGAVHSSVSGIATDGGIARKSRTIHMERDYLDLPEVVTRVDESALAVTETVTEGDQASAFTPALAGQPRPRFQGRRIDLDLKDADIHNVLRLLADVGRINIVTADNVKGSVTIRMKNVPWGQALETVLQAKKLGMVQKGSIVRVAPQSELDKERTLAIARAKQQLALAPLETRIIPVSYADAASIQQRAADLLSSRGTIAVDERTNVMIARDVVGNLAQIEELTHSLDTQTPQVLIEARIVEATSRYLRESGIQWGGDVNFSPATGNPTGLAFPSSIGIAGGASDGQTPTAGLSPFQNTVTNPNFAVNMPAATGTGAGGAIGFTFGSIDNTLNLNLRLSAAETRGMLRILSSPRVLTLDNKQAKISQGTLIPFSQVSAQGVQTTFQNAKMELKVLPHVTADGSVSMHVKVSRDEPDFNQTSARGDPTILKREVETDLLVMDGHTAVIGGIFTRNSGRNRDQVPFFGDIPLLGLLFQHRSESDIRSELVVFITPRIVNRAESLGR
ncbi:MAG: type IV pilus secretin PilQ [Polyangiaceae bacterium]|nr:type IV pilus secretin PilQ [Polyangiaceae bacterium]